MKGLTYILLILSGYFLTGCNDFDVKVTDRLSDEEVWQDENLVLNILANLYYNLQIEHNPSYYYGWLDVYNINLATTSDEGTGAYGYDDQLRYTFEDDWFGIWQDAYKAIRACNVFLKNIRKSTLKKDFTIPLYAEVRFIRAFHYFNLVKRYGGVPLITEPQEYNTPEDLLTLQLPRNKEQDLWDFIISEMEESAPDMPESRDSENRARVTRYSSYALQSRAALYAASIATYGEVQLNGVVGVDPDKAGFYWETAIKAADRVINSGKYELYNRYPDKSENYRNLFLEKRGCGEFIFYKEYLSVKHGHGWDFMNVPFSFRQNGYGCGQPPTLDLIEAYEYVDGSEGKLRTKDDVGEFIAYDSPLDLFRDKDPRLRATFYLPYDECRGNMVEIRRGIYLPETASFITTSNPDDIYSQPGDNPMKILGKDGIWDIGDVGKTGFYTKKFSDESITNITAGQSEAPWPVFRYAEILLNKAEAAMELGQKTIALDALNQVRTRAGIRNLTLGELTLERIRNERRVEFVAENHRHWDLKRWRQSHIVMADFETHALYPWYVWGENKFIFTTARAPKANKVFQLRNYYVKISDEDMNSNPNLAPNNPYF